MENEKCQKELFEFETPKKQSVKFGGIFPRTDFAITLTPEKVVFTAIGLIMLSVVFFALGVEKGKSSFYKRITAANVIAKDKAGVPAIPIKDRADPIFVPKKAVGTNVALKIDRNAPAVKAQAVFDKTMPYTVVAAAFSREEFAIKEVGKLKAAGLEAFIYYGEPYYLACVGSFKNKEAAQKILRKVRQMYRDAYVRLR